MTTTMASTPCESCGMPIEAGLYCQHCVDERGELQSFEDRFERMVEWRKRQEPQFPRAELERKTLAYMATMPAWKDHPRVKAGAKQ
jgi:hypothetical protein